MFATDRPFVLLESRLGPEKGGRLYSDPVEIVECWSPDRVDAALDRIAGAQARGLHAAGYFAYELGYALEPALARLAGRAPDAPLIWFGLFRPPEAFAGAELDALFARLPPAPALTELAIGRSQSDHMRKVEEILALIQAGDLYQANLTFPIGFQYDGPPPSLYAAMRVAQPVAHGGLINTGARWVLSASPELFFSSCRGQVTTRPMKGTTARGDDPAADREARAALAADPKQRAENLMIVDLLRNDLSRVCTPGSVKTLALFQVETYPTFHAMTGTVQGVLQDRAGLTDLLRSLFPCGSVVGAPKIRAAQVIASLEPEPRDAYCGAIGAIAPCGAMSFNVAIRTAVVQPDGIGRYGVGGGVVADSDPAAEYEEALLKARIISDLAQPYHLIETLRWEPAVGFVRLGPHLERLGRSAAALGFPLDRPALIRELRARSADWPQAAPLRVRIALERNGEIAIGAEPLVLPRTDDLRLMISHEALDSADPFLRHKTSRRARHERAFQAAGQLGCDEALLLNETGQLADGARSTLFVARNGRLATPPLTAGALPGILRQALLDGGEAFEAELWPEDLAAGPIFLGSSLRGLRRGTLVDPA